MRRRLCPSPLGIVHYLELGPAEAPAVVLLHQTPRSVDEFAEVVPLLARTHRVVAVDTPGYGCSDRPSVQPSVADYAAAIVAVLDDAKCERAWVAGHHTGGVIGVELAAAHPTRIAGLAFSGPVFVDGPTRAELARHFAQWRPAADGAHLVEKWRKFQGWTDSTALVQRMVTDVFRAGETSEFGHFAVAAYAMEARLPLVRCPGLLIYGRRDPFATRAQAAPLREALRGCREVELDGGVFLPNEVPEAWAEAVRAFAS